MASIKPKKPCKHFVNMVLILNFVPTTGFEPAHLMAPPPQDGMSTNFTTWAFAGAKVMHFFKNPRFRLATRIFFGHLT